MITTEMKAKRGKCLALVAVLAMVVCAFAIVLPAGETDAAESELPTSGSISTQTVDLSSAVTSGERSYTATSPAVLTINYNATTGGFSLFENFTMTIGENVKVVINLTADAPLKNVHIFEKCKITLNGGELILNQSANADGQTWWGQGESTDTLTVADGSKMTINGMGLSGVKAEINGTFEVAEIRSSIAAINFSEGLTIADNATVKVSDGKAFVYFSGEKTKTINGTLDAASSEVKLVSGNIDGSGKIIASELTISDSSSTIGEITTDVQTYKATTMEAISKVLGTQDQVTVTNNINLTADLTVPANKTLILDGCTVTSEKNQYKIIVNGSLVSDGAYIYAGVEINEDTGDFTARNVHKLTSTGTLNSDTKVGFGDELTLSGIVPAGINVYAFGKLIVNDLTVNGAVNAYIGSDVVIDGKVTVASSFTLNDAKLNLAGTIEVKNDKNGGASFELKGASELTIAESGSFRVLKGTANTAAANKLVIAATSDFIVEGTLDVTGTLQGTVKDKGTINFNGTSADATVIVYDGIEFSPVSVTGAMTVSVKGTVKDIDDKAVSNIGATTGTTPNAADGSTVVLDNVKGVKIVSSVDVKKNKAGTAKFYFCNLTVAGTFTAVSKDSTASVTVTAESTGLAIDGKTKYAAIAVADAVALGEGVTFANAGVLTVDGTITAVNKDAVIDNASGKITVNGLITVKTGSGNASIIEGTINSVEYSVTDSEGTVTQYYSGFAAAVDAIATADEKTITVMNSVTASADAEIPAAAIIAVDGTLTIKAGSTLTVADGAVMNVTGTVKVSGTLVIANTDTGLTIGTLVYEVYSENGKTATYTSLANALKNAKEGDVITLSGNVTFSSDAEIPAGVTVNVGKNKVTLGKDVTLTVNGTLNFAKNSELVTTDAKDIVANGVISYYTSEKVNFNSLKIEGAYFELKNVKYISNVAYAAENCDKGTIEIKGNVVAGDVAFKAADSGLAITVSNTNNEVFKAGKVTLDGATLTLNGKMTGTVAAQADGSEAVINLTNAKNLIIVSTVESGVDGDVDKMVLYTTTGTTAVGSGTIPVYFRMQGIVEIASGTITLGDVLYTPEEKSDVFKIASGATLDVPETKALTVVANSGAAGLVVDGTLNVIGTMTVESSAKAIINGTMTVLNENVTINGELSVLGTLEMKDKTDDDNAGKVTIVGVLSVGQKTTSVGAAGTVIGAVSTSATTDSATSYGYVKVYPGADVSAAKIDWNATEVSNAVSMDFNVNGTVYMTIYTSQTDLKIYDIIKAEEFDISGVVNGELTPTATGLYKVDSWFTSEEMKDSQKLTVSTGVSADISAVYAYAAAASVPGTITQGTGLELFIDGVRYTSDMRSLDVGTHTVSFGVKAGFDGSNASITFNGAAVTDGKIVITADMTSFTLVASGAVPASSTVVVDDGKSDGMGLTDILLIVLVVLIAVMAIMVALRMMRS